MVSFQIKAIGGVGIGNLTLHIIGEKDEIIEKLFESKVKTAARLFLPPRSRR